MNVRFTARFALPCVAACLTAAAIAAAPARSPALAMEPPPEQAPGSLVPLRVEPEDKNTRVVPVRRAGQPRTAVFSVAYSGLWPAQARAAFQFAADIWATRITSSVPIQVVARWQPLESGYIGEAGPTYYYRDFAGAPAVGTFYPSAIANRLAGRDLNLLASDITAAMNSAYPSWYFGTDGNPPAGAVDFVSVALHELGHGLGFAGSMTVRDGQGGWGIQGYPTVWDTFPVTATDRLLIDTSAFPNPSVSLANQLQSGNLRWRGAGGAAGSAPPRLYAPSVWQQGSSYLHLDEALYPPGNTDSLMTPTIGRREVIHEPGPIALGILQDMGWGVTPPAPSPTPASPQPSPGTKPSATPPVNPTPSPLPAPSTTPAPSPTVTPTATGSPPKPGGTPAPSATPTPAPTPVKR